MITHDIDETRSNDLRWSLCGVLPVRREAAPARRRAGDLPQMPAIQVGDQLPETPRSEEDCEEDLTGRRKPLRIGSRRRPQGELFVFFDSNGNGVDDGRETQANIFQAFFRTIMDRHPGVVYGAFFWDNWIASDEHWQMFWAQRRSFSIRDKPAEKIVRSAYARTSDPANRPPATAGTLPDRTLAPDRTLNVDVSRAFADPDGDALTYAVSSSAPSVAAARAAGALVTLTAVNEGAATIRVMATDPGGLSATQSFTVTVSTTVSGSFTDDPIQPGVTPVRTVHFTELRTRIDALRRAGGLQVFPWTDQVLTVGVTRVRLEHLLELREALAAAYAAAGRAVPGWTDATPAAGATPIRAAHLLELRAAVLALE